MATAFEKIVVTQLLQVNLKSVIDYVCPVFEAWVQLCVSVFVWAYSRVCFACVLYCVLTHGIQDTYTYTPRTADQGNDLCGGY